MRKHITLLPVVLAAALTVAYIFMLPSHSTHNHIHLEKIQEVRNG